MDKSYSISVRSSHHDKRFHNDEAGGVNDSESVASPDTILTTTVTNVHTIVSSIIATNEETSSIAISSAQLPVSSETPDSGAARGASDMTQTTSAVSSSPSSSGLPVGAVAGIVLVIIISLAAACMFWFRRRSIASRLKKRRWNKQQTKASSFLFIEPNDSSKVLPIHVTLQSCRGRDIAAPATMTKGAHDGPPYIPYPVPPRPPPVAGMYDDHEVPISPVTTPSSKVSAKAFSLPTSPNFTPSPSQLEQAKTVKVRATFIPTLPDELTITIGELVRIHTKYDDGWALCSNARGEMGMLPLECLDIASQHPWEKSPKKKKEYRKSVRASSLAATHRSPSSGSISVSSHRGNQH